MTTYDEDLEATVRTWLKYIDIDVTTVEEALLVTNIKAATLRRLPKEEYHRTPYHVRYETEYNEGFNQALQDMKDNLEGDK